MELAHQNAVLLVAVLLEDVDPAHVGGLAQLLQHVPYIFFPASGFKKLFRRVTDGLEDGVAAVERRLGLDVFMEPAPKQEPAAEEEDGRAEQEEKGEGNPIAKRFDPVRLSQIVEAIRQVGPSQTVLTTDAIQTWNPPPPEVMRMYIGSLLHVGVDEESIRKMIQENPLKILGLREMSWKDGK